MRHKRFCHACREDHSPDVSCKDAKEECERKRRDRELHTRLRIMNRLYWDVNRCIEIDREVGPAECQSGPERTSQVIEYDEQAAEGRSCG